VISRQFVIPNGVFSVILSEAQRESKNLFSNLKIQSPVWGFFMLLVIARRHGEAIFLYFSYSNICPMKFLTLLFLFILVSCGKETEFTKATLKPTEIDSLRTNAQIENYIAKHDTLYRKFTLKRVQDITCISCDSTLKNLANRLKVNYSYTKADLDNNGYTDLVVTGINRTYTSTNTHPDMLVEWSRDFNAFVLMNFGAGNVKLHDLTDGLWYGLVPKVESINSRPTLVVYKPPMKKTINGSGKPETRTVLTYAFGDFVEYNSVPPAFLIEKIEYATNGCMGECPIFKLDIEQNGKATFKAEHYNYTRPWQQGKILTGTYKTTLKEADYNQIKDLLNYLDFQHLQNNYNVSWTDDQSAVIKITYNGGKVKTITDYGEQGTYGLRQLHKILYAIRLNQDWNQVQ
jgi:Domain of unknown function (DUF6438)